MYKEASKQKLRFQTDKGLLTPEQLWDLPIETLDRLAVHLEEQYENSKGKSFLVKKSDKDKTAKLRFDIALDILGTKVEEAETQRTKLADKEHNQKILALIESRKERQLEQLPIEELEKMLK